MSAGGGPPALFRALLRRALPSGHRGDAVLGDLDERFAELQGTVGRAGARSWYRRQALQVLLRYVLPRSLGLIPRIDEGGTTEPAARARLLHGLFDDLRYAGRRLQRQPVAALLTIATLAFAIGANTAIFSVVDAVLWKPLPFPEADRLVQVQETNHDYVVERQLDYGTFNVNALDFLQYEAGARAFESMAFVVPYHNAGYTLVGGEGLPAERVEALGVSHDFFEAVGVQPTLGRAFLSTETAPPGEYDYTPVVIISHELWVRRFGADPDIVGKTIRIEAGPSTVVGVTPPDFVPPPFSIQGETRVFRPDVFFPPFYEAFYQPNRRFRQLVAIGRLGSAAGVDDAEADLRRVAAGLEEEDPDRRAGWTPIVVPIEEMAGNEVETGLYALMGAVLFVLLIGCANLANLLLALGSARRGELAVRSALGSGRRRLVRQLVTESTLLAAVGGVLGVVLAWSASGALLDLVPVEIPMATDPGLDGRVLAFAVTLTVGTVLVFSLLPAVRSSRVDVASMLKAGGGSSGSAKGAGFSGGLILVQVALTLVLLVGSALLAKSFVRLQSVPLGFAPENLLVASLHRGRQSPERVIARNDEEGLRRRWERIYSLKDAIDTIPGVESVFFAGALPIEDGNGVSPIQFERTAQGQRPERTLNATLAQASPGYFDALGIPIVLGTGLPEWDRENDWARYWWATDCRPEHEAYCVAVVSETFAATAWPGEDPIGKELGLYGCCWRVVGVAADVQDRPLHAHPNLSQVSPSMTVYAPVSEAFNVVVKTRTDPLDLIPAVRAASAEANPDVGLTFSTMRDRVAASLARPRFYLLTVGLFGVAALVLSLLGLYGVVAYAVGRRTREIGMRIALGARRDDVHRMVVSDAMIPVGLGIVVGIIGALGLERVMGSLLYGLEGSDPVLFGAVAFMLTVVCAISGYVPARRASSVDPVRALSAD